MAPTRFESDGAQACLYLGSETDGVEVHGIGSGEAAVFSKAAPHRPGANEDAAAVLPVGSDACVLIVADGMGGAPAGATASGIAVERIRESVEAAVKGAQELRNGILDGIERANAAIRQQGVGAATTLCVAEIDKGRFRPYHVGDSSIFALGQRGKLKLQTTPHSPVGFAVEAGVLDAADALTHEDLHLVSNALGAADMRIEVGSARTLAPRDTVLLATDGLTDNLRIEEILEIVRCGPIEGAVIALAREADRRMEGPRASEPSKPDDLTIVAYRPTRSHATAPSSHTD